MPMVNSCDPCFVPVGRNRPVPSWFCKKDIVLADVTSETPYDHLDALIGFAARNSAAQDWR